MNPQYLTVHESGVTPPAAIWVWGEDYIFLKSMWEVSGLTCELTSLEVVPPIT